MLYEIDHKVYTIEWVLKVGDDTTQDNVYVVIKFINESQHIF